MNKSNKKQQIKSTSTRVMTYREALDDALTQAMAADERIVIFGEDTHTIRMNQFLRFGNMRVRPTPISEAAFVGMAVSAAMSGLRPVAELIMVDFLPVAIDALINHAAKIKDFSGGKWQVPMVIRAGCGGGYGDAGQHEQTLWGWIAHIPGVKVVVPSTPADAGGLLLAALQDDAPVVFLEHQLLAQDWLEYLGTGGRKNVTYDLPPEGVQGDVPSVWQPIPMGKAVRRATGDDVTIVGVGVGIHRGMQAAEVLNKQGISASVIDLRTVVPLDRDTVVADTKRTGRLVVVDEDYKDFGLSGELAATLLEAGVPAKYARVCVESTIPYDQVREREVLPNVERIVAAVKKLM